MLTGLDVLPLACKCVFYRLEVDAKKASKYVFYRSEHRKEGIPWTGTWWNWNLNIPMDR